MKLNDHERAIRATLARCKKAIGEYDEIAAWSVKCEIATNGRGLCYLIVCESRLLARAPRKSTDIGGLGGTLEEAEELFHKAVKQTVERKAQATLRIRLRTRTKKGST